MRFNGYRLAKPKAGVAWPLRTIATAAHVVRKPRRRDHGRKGAKARARVVCIDKAVDVAVLRVERPPKGFATIAQGPPSRRVVRAVERPSPVKHRASPPGPSRPRTGLGWRASLIFSGIKGEKGMSGGGLFDAAGDLLGIVIRIDGRFGYLSALPVTELCVRFSRCAGDGPPALLTQACEAGASQWPVAPRDAAELPAPVYRAARRGH